MQVLRRFPNPEILNLSVSVGHGGEACIYAVPLDENLVAKIYHKPTISYAQKLRAMLANPPVNPTDNLGHIAIAWPQELLQSWQNGPDATSENYCFYPVIINYY